MKRGLLFSIIALAVFAVSIVSADVRSLLRDERGPDRNGPDRKGLPRGDKQWPVTAGSGFAAVDARTYRSPGKWRKVVVAANDREALREAIASGAVELSDYGSFKLLAIDREPAEEMGARLSSREGATPDEETRHPFIVRDDFNALLLRSGAIDTTADDAPGRFFGLGRATGFNVAASQSAEETQRAGALRLIQFIGPIKRQWLDELRASGFELIAYVPNNGYLVRGGRESSDRLMKAASRAEGFIQWEGEFKDEYKIHPALRRAMQERAAEEVTVAVQVARPPSGRDVKAVKRMASSVISDAYSVMNFTNLRVRIQAGRVGELAALADVVNVEPWSPPRLMDERAAQVIAANLTDDSKQARGPGYMQWLASHGFTSRFDFAIDVSDTGVDRGSTSPDKLHPDFIDGANRSRLLYARDYTSELDPGDVPGHGTINLSIAGGGNTSAGKEAHDASGFSYGMGVAPFALLGSSKIFQSNANFDLVEPYTKLISEAYRSGARVSSNSWSDITNSYTIDAQEYDARVRDAVPAEPGNQEIPICFAAGNAGQARRIGSPGSAKNVISVAASESSRKDGLDGCGVKDTDSDSVIDVAFFSSGGPCEDGRVKPDIAAPGTHMIGAASQHPDFDGLGICGQDFDKPYFPEGQKLYTWSSGTSHSTPVVAGAAALLRQFFLNRGEQPSAALIKALLINTTTYMTGTLAGGDLPHPRQGWGLLNLNRALDSTPKIFINQTDVLGESGQQFVMTGEVKDSNQPVRITLAWTDAPGFSGFAPWVNDLDLEVTINGQLYRGNNFRGQQSEPGGEPNTKDNTESVWLPAGTAGTFVVRVKAANIAGDGVPGNQDATDQDFALVVYNGERKDVAVAELAGVKISAGADETADPGETVSMKLTVGDASPVAFQNARGVITTATRGVTVTAGAADFPTIAAGETGESLTAFAFAVDKTVACGSVIEFTLDVASAGSVSRVPFSVTVGRRQAAELFSDDVESGGAKWTHASALKKKKKVEPVDTWAIATKRFRSGASSWFSSDPGKLADSHLDSQPVQLPADGRNLRLVFYHTFEFERGAFDGGVIEISTGGEFEDLGAKILRGNYTGVIGQFTTNPLADRSGWVEGRLGQLQQVVVDLSSYAGKSVVIRFRVGTDNEGRGLGWFIDDVSVRGDRVTCTPVAVN